GRGPLAGGAPRTGRAAPCVAGAHELRVDRARPRRRVARRRESDRDAQRPRAEDRHAGRDRERRRGPGDLHGEPALMAWFSSDRRDRASSNGPVLAVANLDVYYGRAHALQGVSLVLERGVLGIVGRNGMGKTTLCNAITGLVPARG